MKHRHLYAALSTAVVIKYRMME